MDNQNETWNELQNLLFMPTVLTVCAWCRKVKRYGWDEKKQNSWLDPNDVSLDPNTLVSHSICPQCSQQIREGLKSA